jgi:hypothetical protein
LRIWEDLEEAVLVLEKWGQKLLIMQAQLASPE